MTKETCEKKVKAVLAEVPGIRWNSDSLSRLAALARRFSEGEMTTAEVVSALHAIFPLAKIDRHVESDLMKALR